MNIGRRRFFCFLGAAAASPIIHHIIPEKLIFDMAGPVRLSTMDELNSITVRELTPQLADEVFKTSPLFNSLTAKKLEEAYRTAISGYDEPDLIIVKGMATYRHLERMCRG